MRCRAILFDLDGVLVDSRAVVERTWARWMARHGLDIPDLVQRAHGRRSRDTVGDVAPHLDVEEEVRWLEGAELSDREGLSVLAGARELYESLGDGQRAIVTSCGRPLAELRLRAACLAIPAVLVSADVVARGKPEPDGYLLAAGRLGVRARDCVVVEDTPAGIRAGRAAGARTLGVATTMPAHELTDADAVVPSLAGVVAETKGDYIHLSFGGAPARPA